MSVATVVPAHSLHQGEVRSRASVVFDSVGELMTRLAPIYDNAGIDTRYSCVPMEWYEAPHGWADRTRAYVENAVALTCRAAADCLADARLGVADVDALVVASTTGISTPSVDALVIERLGLRRDVRRLPIFGLGCAGGVLGLARAAEVAGAHPGSRVLLLVVELCGLTFRRNDMSKSNIVATALFGDGAAAVLLSTQGTGPAVTFSAEHTWPGSLDVMGWGVEDDGLRVLFSRDIPALIRSDFRAVLDRVLARYGFVRADVDRFLCHPGGAKVLDALEEVLGMPSGGLTTARQVLRDFGNMSAVTVLFVLQRTLADGTMGNRALMTALGPGFTAAFLMLESDGEAGR